MTPRVSAVWVGAFLLLAMLSTSALAQNHRARISGIVTDQSEAVVAGATVTLLNINTGVPVVRQTSESGLYLFDLVDPGTYRVTVEFQGFNKFVQENIVAQMRGDITVNAKLTPGAVQESITVSESPVAVQFNSAAKDFTIDSKLAAEIPRIDRNPFKLTLLAPSAVNTRGEMQPYHSWAANSVDLGGGTNLKNDLQVDGSPIGIGHKNSYPPNTDAVQEVVVSQNPVDAESGHSAGGLISLTLKSGTNEFHGSAFIRGAIHGSTLNRIGPGLPAVRRASTCSAAHWVTRFSRTSSSTSSPSRSGKSTSPAVSPPRCQPLSSVAETSRGRSMPTAVCEPSMIPTRRP